MSGLDSEVAMEVDGAASTPLDLDNLQEIEVPEPLPVAACGDEESGRLMISHMTNINFKSYAGSTVLGPFQKSFTCIVGPNGSGKSNVIDAMLFVFGFRANKIRSKKLSVLIHNSERHQNIASCTVKVHFQRIIDTGSEDDDYTVIADSQFTVSRTAYKDNSSIYQINNKKSSAKDVIRLLLSHGFDLDHNRFLILQMLEGRWISSSKEIIAFRRSLLNPVVSYQFQRFVSIKSDLLENDVLFWRECQKYKNLHHQHTDDSFIVQKINVIINCFIVTNMEPALQIDIPQDQADRISEKRRELGPYIFREAQLTVFRVLFEHWAEFCNFKSNTATDQILPTVERKRRRAKLRERQRLKELEEQQEKENARRRALGLPVEGEDNKDADAVNADTTAQKEEEDDEKSDTAEGQKLMWSYSNYMEGLDKEDIINRTSEETFSCISSESRKENLDTDKPSIDVSDLKDLKAPPDDRPAIETEVEVKPTNSKKKSQEKTDNTKRNSVEAKIVPTPPTAIKNGSSSHKAKDKKVCVQLDIVNRAAPAPVKYKPTEKAVPAMSRAMPPLVKK